MTLLPFHHSASESTMKRFRLWKRQYLHVVIYTSLFWIFIDVFFMMLFSDCTKQVVVPCASDIRSKGYEPIVDQKPVNIDGSPNSKFNRDNIKRKNILERKRLSQTKKNSGFMAKIFGSNPGKPITLIEKHAFLNQSCRC